jgi:hypothetical protein
MLRSDVVGATFRRSYPHIAMFTTASLCFVFLFFPSLAASRPSPCEDGFHDYLPCSTPGWALNGPASYVDPTGRLFTISASAAFLFVFHLLIYIPYSLR